MPVQLLNNQTRYGLVAQILHWIIAIGIIGLLITGSLMVGKAEGVGILSKIAHAVLGTEPDIALYQTHKAFGIIILGLSVLRLLWRLVNRTPPLPSGMRLWERFAAKFTHVAFYLLMIGMPLGGWYMVSASPITDLAPPAMLTDSLTGIKVPDLPPYGPQARDAEMEHVFKSAHAIGGLILALVLVLHIGAALKHLLINRDGVFSRMLPGPRHFRRG